MYKDDYISAFGKLTPSETWKSETLAKMRALEQRQGEKQQGEQQQKESRAGSGGAPAAVGHAAEKRPVPLAVHLRRAALPIAAVAMLAILPMTALRGCGASGGNNDMALQAEDRASDECAPAAAEPAPRDTAGGAENGTTVQTPAAPSGGAGLYDGVTEEAQREADSAQSMASAPVPAPSPSEDWVGNSGEAVTVLEQPPVMAVIGTLDETYHNALQGGYSWQSKNADGTFVNTEADGAHPLACKTQLSPALEMTYDRTLNLIFPEGAAPDGIVGVRCWSDASWGNTAAESETVAVRGSAAGGDYAIELKPGGYIYEVTVRWDTADGYGGTASYAFYVKGIE